MLILSVSQVLGNQHGVTVAAWCIVMSLVMRMVQPSGDSRLCGTSLDLGDEGLEDEPARFATSRVGHSIIGLQPNGVPYTYSHIRSLVVQRTQETLPQTQAQACLWSRARSRLFLQDECSWRRLFLPVVIEKTGNPFFILHDITSGL